MRQRRVLENIGALLNSFRLPRELTLEARGCDGRETAWYDREAEPELAPDRASERRRLFVASLAVLAVFGGTVLISVIVAAVR